MNLSQLEMLLAVVETGGYVKAGERLNISHSAIHRQVRLLEQELADPVLVRSGKVLELTEAGRIVAELARRVRQDVANTLRQVRELTEIESGHLRVGTGTTMLVFFMPRVLERFRAEYPGVTVHLMTGTAEQVIDEIETGGLDLGIIFSTAGQVGRRRPLDSELLYREEFVLAVGKAHPLAKRRTVSLADLNDVPFITYSKTSYMRRTIEEMFARERVAPRIIMELENEEAIEKMIEIDMGVSLLSRRRAVSDRVHYLKIRDHPVYCETRLVFLKSGYLPRAAREFARLCRETRARL